MIEMLIYSLFLWVCDGMKLRLGFFTTLGTNSLAAYMLHDIAGWIPIGGYENGKPLTVDRIFPHDSSTALEMVAAVAVQILFVYIVCRILQALGWYIRV